MLQRQSHAPASVYALADHLDAVLAACEDLLALNGRTADPEWFLASVRRFELAAILQALRARQYAEELRGEEPRVAAVASLFLAGTIVFTEATGARVNSPFEDVERGDWGITDEFMIAHRIPIGVLAEMAGAFLDALEVHYVVYETDAARIGRSGRALPPPLPPVAREPLPLPR